MIQADPMIWSPLPEDAHNTLLFFLPDRYQLMLNASKSTSVVTFPRGKISDLAGGPSYGAAAAYASADVNFYFKSIYGSANAKDWFEDYNFLGISLQRIESKQKVRKILNIIGIDYIIFSKSYFNDESRVQWSDNFEPLGSLSALGYIPFNTPDSLRFPFY